MRLTLKYEKLQGIVLPLLNTDLDSDFIWYDFPKNKYEGLVTIEQNIWKWCIVLHVEDMETHILKKAGHIRLVPELWPSEELSMQIG